MLISTHVSLVTSARTLCNVKLNIPLLSDICVIYRLGGTCIWFGCCKLVLGNH